MLNNLSDKEMLNIGIFSVVMTLPLYFIIKYIAEKINIKFFFSKEKELNTTRVFVVSFVLALLIGGSGLVSYNSMKSSKQVKTNDSNMSCKKY